MGSGPLPRRKQRVALREVVRGEGELSENRIAGRGRSRAGGVEWSGTRVERIVTPPLKVALQQIQRPKGLLRQLTGLPSGGSLANRSALR
jgi:hypothetical protein